MNDELEKICKETAVTFFPRVTEKSHNKMSFSAVDVQTWIL
jgi:hypothetical protein